jgi:Tol biopolymer transport system component
MNIDGSCQVNITNNPASDYVPCFSPDGTKITFTSYPEPVIDYEVPYEIYIMNVDGSGQTNISNTPDEDEQASCFSPDGSKIAFQTGRDKIRGLGGYLSNEEIYLMNPDGSCQVNITNNPDGDDMFPCFSP